MKKILSVLLALVLLLSLCACGKNDPAATDPTGTSAAAGSTETTGAAADSTKGATKPSETPTVETDPLPEDPGICSHMWGNATCTTGRICSMCFQEEAGSEPLGHKWKDATCTTPKTCSRCGATEGDPAEHNYVDGVCTLCKTNAPT